MFLREKREWMILKEKQNFGSKGKIKKNKHFLKTFSSIF